MKIQSTFHVAVLFTSLLTLGMPVVTLAQQNSELAEAVIAAEQDAKVDVNQGVWGAVGFLCGFPTLYIAFVHQPPPPAARFIGKSPEYIHTYTQIYKTKVRNRQTGPATLGCLAGSLALYLYALVSD